MIGSNLEFEGCGAAEDLLENYNSDTDEWNFPQDGEFWRAVRAAHATGTVGQDKTIAIIDGAFDLETPRLRNQAKGAVHRWAGAAEDRRHGTAVALLVSTVAPAAKFDLYEISKNENPSGRLLLKALNLARQSNAVAINLSLGRPVDQVGFFSRFLKREGHCEICRAASAATFDGKSVVAAVGNAMGSALCPARDQAVFGIGFQTVKTMIQKASDGGTFEVAYWDEPSYTQCSNPDFTLMQPEGVLGSSFATPLVTGAMALIEDAKDIPRLIAAGKVAGMAEFLQANLRLKDSPTRQDIDLVKTLYLNAISLLPHRHKGKGAGQPCVGCAIFAEHIYVNAGLFFLESRELDLAEDLLSAARWFAPWSPHAAANFATLLRAEAEQCLVKDSDPNASADLFRRARNEYLHALELRPGFDPYISGLKIVDEWLNKLSEGSH